jgi:hypothetical protein
VELDKSEAKGVTGKEMGHGESKDQEGNVEQTLLYLRVSHLVSSYLYVLY